MPVRRRTDNGHWLIDFRDSRGGRHRITLPEDQSGLTKRQAEAVERQLRQEIEAEQPGPADTWGALAARYWEEHGQHLSWQDSVSGHLDRLSDLIGDHTMAREITPDTFARGVAQWRGELAPATVNLRLAVAQNLWTRAAKLWGIPMPAIPWDMLRLDVPDRLPGYVPPAVRDAIMSCARPHVRLAMRLALATGWRRSSVLGLRWEHIDWHRGLVFGRGKGRAGGKILVHPLTAEIVDILLEPGPQPAVGPVVHWRFKPVLDIKRSYARARSDAGYPGVLFKDLRHSVAQEILAATGSLDLAGAALAHSQPSVTRKHYARVQVDAIRKALEARALGTGMGTGTGTVGASSRNRTGDLQSHNLVPFRKIKRLG